MQMLSRMKMVSNHSPLPQRQCTIPQVISSPKVAQLHISHVIHFAGRSKGWGIVEFDTPEAVSAASNIASDKLPL